MYKLAVVIPSAGKGSRFKSKIPKPYVLLKGRPIIQRTVDLFTSLPFVKQIIISTSVDLIEHAEHLFENYNVPVKVIEGGATRQNSVHNASPFLNDDIDLVAVHDAVRPLVSPGVIEKCCTIALNVGGAVVGMKAKDTIKRVDEDNFVLETPERKNLWQCQTPQIFKKDIFINAFNYASENGFIGTDDASVVEFFGNPVKMVEGNPENIKITYPLDLKIAEYLLENK